MSSTPPTQETNIEAFTSYLEWLTKTPLLTNESIRFPSPAGWKLTNNAPQLVRAGKSALAIQFLRHMPFVMPGPHPLPIAGNSTRQVTCYFTKNGLDDIEDAEEDEIEDQVELLGMNPPSQILDADEVCLTTGGREESYLLLDTRTCLVREYVLYESPLDENGEVDESPKAYKRLPEQDLRDILKKWRQNFEDLEWVIVPAYWHVTMIDGPDPEEKVDQARDIYEEYGWPEEGFRLEECKAALQQLVDRWDGRDPELES